MSGFALLIALTPSIAAVIVAAVLALRDADSWGWFLLAAVVLSGAGQMIGGGQ